jgi:CO dehydrogenase maturation factor
MTAGADSFASGLFTKFDLTVLVAEPTTKALSVYEQYKTYAKDYDVALAVVGNKIENDDDIAFLKNAAGTDLLTCVRRSAFVQSGERGEVRSFDGLEPENRDALETIRTTLDRQPKDWRKFYRQSVEFHLKNALSWANAALGKDLRDQIDPDFVLADAV